MAASTSRLVRRPKSAPTRRSLTAASQPVLDPQKHFKSALGGVGSRVDWQLRAWDYFDGVGEFQYWVNWRAQSCSRVRLVASEVDPETGLPTGGIDPDNAEGQFVNDIVHAIAGGPLGQAELIRRAVECMSVTGEVWICILVRDEGEMWVAVTKEEVKRDSYGTKIELPDGTDHRFQSPRDSMIRVWKPHARKAREATSPVRAAEDSLREIVDTTKTIRSAAKSRLIGNGIIFVPHEMSLPTSSAPVASNKPGAPLAPLHGQPAVKQLTDMLYQQAQVAIEDPDSAAAHIPIIAGVPGEQTKNIHHLKIDTEVTEVAIKTRTEAIVRLAQALDVSPERLLGLGKESNHWSAWQIGDEDVQLHVNPPMELLCGALTREVLRILLEKNGIDVTRYVVWYDSSKLTADPDKTDESQSAFDGGAIRADAYRRYQGLADDDGYDLSTLEGAQIWARDAVTKDPNLLSNPAMQMLLGGELESIEWPAPPQALPPGEDDPDAEDDDTGGSREQEPDTEDAVTASLAASGGRDVELAIVEFMVNRCLELAGKRMRTRADFSRLASVPMHQTHRYMDPIAPADVERYIRGWDSILPATASRLGISIDRVRAVVAERARRELTRPIIDAEAS